MNDMQEEMQTVAAEMVGFFFWVKWAGIVGVVALFGLLYDSKKREQARSIRQVQYLRDHGCVVAGYAGNVPQAVYRCDNGMIMRRDIP
jgi:hypothetical protein